MKKIILSCFFAAGISFSGISQTATNFNCNDCAGNNHDLFTELAAGKVIVMTWVMPCSACIGVASSVATTVQGYASSNPGQVKFYLIDDYANTSCSTLDTWANTNAISTDADFSNAAINMTDYGTAAMQKTVVLGGPNNFIWDDELGAINVSQLQTAINSAIASVGISVNGFSIGAANVFPNPVHGNSLMLNYSVAENSNVSINIYNTVGTNVKNVSIENVIQGSHSSVVDVANFSSGVYFIKISAGASSQVVRFVISD